MAWDAMFRVPLVGALMRAFGAFPVDVRPGKGREAYAKAKALLEQGELVGIFPEGKRSRTGWMEESLREGAARLAWETGAPLVPATITGAFRAWPHYQALPRPARIRVRFHEPIDPSPYRALPEEEALPAMLAELRRRVERSLLPGVKADLRRQVLQRMPAPWPRTYEVAAGAGRRHARVLEDAVVHGGAAGVHLPRVPVPRPLRGAAVLAREGACARRRCRSSPSRSCRCVLSALGLPEPAAGEALWALVLGALFPYLYERGTHRAGRLPGAGARAGARAGRAAARRPASRARTLALSDLPGGVRVGAAHGLLRVHGPDPRRVRGRRRRSCSTLLRACSCMRWRACVAWGLMALVPRRRGTAAEAPPEPGLGLRLR